MAKRKTNKKKQQKLNNNLIIGIVAVFAIGIIGASVFSAPTQEDTSTLPLEISVQEALAMREEGTLILDVRTPGEWVEGHVPGATLIPLDELESRLSELPQDEEIVVICRSGNRSATARDILKKAGFSSVTSVAGGFNEWVTNGYPAEVGH